MATGDKKPKYTGEDKVTEWLLNQVVKHVNNDEIGFFARDLGVPESVYTSITKEKDKTFKVLQSWLQDLPDDFAVKDLINELSDWIEEGYVHSTVWKRLKNCVTPGVLPVFSVRRSARKHPGLSSPEMFKAQSYDGGEFSSVKKRAASSAALIVRLDDSHIARLSGRINLQELQDLGTIGFNLDKTSVDNALYDNRHNIQGAALEVLRMGLNKQSADKSRYECLLEALRKCKMNQLAADLKKMVEGPEDAPQKAGQITLEDSHILNLSQQITTEQELRDLGTNALDVPEHIIDTALYNHRASIQEAAYVALSTWLKQYQSRQKAYINLQAGLKRAQMNQLAALLRKWSGGIDDPAEQFFDLQQRTRRSIRRTWQNYLSNDWLRPEKAKKMPLSKIYTDLVWTKKVRGIRDTRGKMKSMYEIIQVEGAGEKRLNVLVQAKPGMGKTSSLAYLGMEWVEHPDEFLFDFVFIIRLRKVDTDTSLAQVIIDQHEELDDEDREYLEALLSRKTKHKVLLLLDGYDEYRAGTNKALDKAIESGIGNCFTILTSRPGTDSGDNTYVSQEIRDKMDGEVRIDGFSEENKERFCIEYFESEEECQNLLAQAKEKLVWKRYPWESGADRYNELLSTPIVLLMTCVLYEENRSLPDTRAKIYETVRELAMDRTTWKTFGCKSSQVRNINRMTSVLGKFAWEALNRDIQQLLLNKEDLEKECPDILKIGLLHEVDGPQRATLRGQPSQLSFTHKSLQEMEASKFVTQELETSKSIKETLNELFPSWEAVERYRQVVTFTTGLMKDPRPLVQHVYEMQIEDYLNNMRTGGNPLIDADLLQSIHAESTVLLVDDPFHNKYINHYNHCDDTDSTPVYFPSRLYVFDHMNHKAELDHFREEEKIPPCTMVIRNPSEELSDTLLSICSEISKHQAVTDLRMVLVTSNSLEAPWLINPVRVVLTDCKFPDDFMEKFLRQLKGSGESLQKLVLNFMNLAPFESLLDELLEDLVFHHQRKREAGLAQRKLRLRLIGDEYERSTLSEEFMQKWRKRCESVDSIDCFIGSDMEGTDDTYSIDMEGTADTYSIDMEGTADTSSSDMEGTDDTSSSNMEEASDVPNREETEVKYLETICISFFSSKYPHMLDENGKLKDFVERHVRKSYPVELFKNHQRSFVAITDGYHVEYSVPHSDISLEVRHGVHATITHKIYTDLEAAECALPKDECIVSPVVAFKAELIKSSSVSNQPRFTATIPHCLPEKYDLSLIKVRCERDGHTGFLREIHRKEDGSPAETPYYQVDNKYIKVYADHFCPIVCTSEKKICDSSLVILPFGYLYPDKDENQTMAKVKVFLCSYLFNKPDVRRDLENDQNRRGLELLESKNLFIEVEGFDPYNSQITLSMKPATDAWKTLTKTSKKSKLQGVVDIVEGHFCRSSITKDAATFDLMNSELKTSFHALLDVILHVARKPEHPKDAMQTVDPSEKFAISIPPLESQKTTSRMDRSNLSEGSKRKLNTAMMLKLSKRINRAVELNFLAVIGLEFDENVVDRHIKDKKDEFTMAVYGFLKEWSNSIETPEEAYRILYEALGKEGVDMKHHRKALE